MFSSNWAQILCVCVLLSEIELLRNVEKVQAGEQRKGTSGGIGGVDVKEYELMIAALHLLIFLSRFCCVRASFCGFHPAFALQCSL